jgi:hypothetical protein
VLREVGSMVAGALPGVGLGLEELRRLSGASPGRPPDEQSREPTTIIVTSVSPGS